MRRRRRFTILRDLASRLRRTAGPSRGGSNAPGRPTILLFEQDPYLTFLIQLDLPEAKVVEASPLDDVDRLLSSSPDLVIVDLAAHRARQLLARRNGSKVIGIIEGTRVSRSTPPPEVDGLLLRPFVPGELHRAVRGALGLPQLPPPPTPVMEKIQRWLGPARLAAIALAAVLEVSTASNPLRTVNSVRGAILLAAFAYVAIRFWPRRTGPFGAAADVVFAATLHVLSAGGGTSTNYALFGLVASVEAGLVLGMRTGMISGTLISVAAARQVLGQFQSGSAASHELGAFLLLFPLAGLAAGLAARIWGSGRSSEEFLAEANRVLSTLHRIARTMPGRLELGGVASDALRKVQESVGSPAALVLLGDAGVFVPVGSYGLTEPQELAVRRNDPFLVESQRNGVRVAKSSELPPPIAGALGEYPCWLVAPLHHGGTVTGVILAACPEESRHDASRLFLQQLAAETAVGVENAQLFRRVREMSIDEERRRLARELHDGVAQPLAHIRLELEYMADHDMPDPVGARQEARRLARVAERAALDVRSMIRGLNSFISSDGLVASLRSYLRDLNGLGGPVITFESEAEVALPPEVEADAFRIAQEAVSNAIRHSRARRVRVSLESEESELVLEVEDDGTGVLGDATDGGGLGLRAMRERASGIGADLDVNAVPGKGTTVRLKVDENVTAGTRI